MPRLLRDRRPHAERLRQPTGVIRRTPPSRSPQGLLEKMNRIELEGVLAHELSHIKNYDILVSTLAVVDGRCDRTAVRARYPPFMIFGGGRDRSSNDNGGNPIFPRSSPWCSSCSHRSPPRSMQFAVGIVRREALADISAIEITRYPPGLISALEKLQADHTIVRENNHAHRASLDRRTNGSLLRRQRAQGAGFRTCSTRTRPSRNASPPLSASCKRRLEMGDREQLWLAPVRLWQTTTAPDW